MKRLIECSHVFIVLCSVITVLFIVLKKYFLVALGFRGVQLICSYPFQVLCLWDVSSQLCVRRLAGVFPETQGDAQTLLFVHEERGFLVLSFNSRLLLLEEQRKGRGAASTSTL